MGFKPSALLLLALAFVSVAFSAADSVVVVNSQSWEDVIAGSVYAASNGYSYFFVLTPSHGAYLASRLVLEKGDVQYFESGSPVSEGFSSSLSGLGSRLSSVKQPDLASYFAGKAPKASAIIVGKESGAEALSVAPYAALTKSALWFSDRAGIDSTAASAKSQYSKVMVYGSVASSLKSTGGIDVINSGSVYSDNAKILEMFLSSSKDVSQVAVVSGRTFEKSMVSASYPLIIVGSSDFHPQSASALSAAGIKGGMVFQGDSDIVQAVDGLKSKAGLSVFAKLGEGYSGDVAMKDLAVVPIPYVPVNLDLSGLVYNFAKKTFQVDVKNTGMSPAYIRMSVHLPSGQSASSVQTMVASGKTETLAVPLSLAADSSTIPEATVSFSFGPDAVVLDSAKTDNYSQIRVVGKPAPAAPAPAAPVPQPAGGQQPLLVLIVVLIAGAAAYFALSGKKK